MPAASPGARPGSARPGSGRVFYGWTVVVAAFFVLFMAYGTQYAFGVFFAALVDEFGWSRASLSGVFSLYAAVYSGFALVAVPLTDRWGPPPVLRIGRPLVRGRLDPGSPPAGAPGADGARLGTPPLLAATLVSTVGASALVGRLVMGGTSDHIGRRGALAIALALQAGAFVGFAQAHDLAALYASSLVFGFSYGAASTLFPAAVADDFGREQAGSLARLLFALARSLAAPRPLPARFLYDRPGDHPPALVL